MDEFMHYGVAAGVQAVTDSGIDFTKTDRERAASSAAPASAACGPSSRSTTTYLKAQSPRKISPFFVPADHHQHDLRAPVDPLRPARARTSASSPPAPPPRTRIGLGMRTIQYGDADVMIAGGAEMATTRCGLGGFGQAKALSTRNDAPTGGEPPVGPRPRRLRARRWRRRGAARGARARPAPRRAHLRRAGRLWHERRCPSHHRAARGRRGRAPGDGRTRCAMPRLNAERGAVHQRARDLDAARRQGRDHRHQARLRRARQEARGELDQVDDRAPAGRGRRASRRSSRSSRSATGRPADHQLRHARIRTATWTTCPTPRAA